MQIATIEFARNVLKLEKAHSTEFEPGTPHPVIAMLDEQRKITKKGGTMRLGAQPCQLKLGTKAAELYGSFVVNERHRHRYEFNNIYREKFEKAGFVFSGLSPDGKLVEVIELKDHPFLWRASSIRNFRANRTSRIRCSRASSPPRTQKSIRSRCKPGQSQNDLRRSHPISVRLAFVWREVRTGKTHSSSPRWRAIRKTGSGSSMSPAQRQGSTCAMLESIYRAAGLRVGLFTSPHLVSFRERIQVNRQLISEGDVVRLVENCSRCSNSFRPPIIRRFFEVITVMALKYFAEQKCDLVIWEPGWAGGSTHEHRRAAGQRHHQHRLRPEQWLGDTLERSPPKKPASSSRACRHHGGG